MISVKKNFKKPPSKLRGGAYRKKLKKLLDENIKHEFLGYYNDSTVFNALVILYNKKCAYCETKMNAGYKLQIEHYRPKKSVEEDDFHHGYYWLGYEWSNLLLACPKCNQQGAKGNYFPIKGKRVYVHEKFLTDNILDVNKCCINRKKLLDEEPLLLNPEIVEVEKHLIFLPNGEIRGLSEQGKLTIEICNLNNLEKREDLILARKYIVDNILINLKKHLKNFIQKDISKDTLIYNLENIFLNILEKQDKTSEYSRVYFFIYNKFEIFILNSLAHKQRALVEKIFIAFRLNL